MAMTDRDNDAQHGMTFQDPDPSPPDVEVLSEKMQEPPVKFEIPENCRTFSPFPRLPPELRHQIWEATLTTPGMHFLKVDTDYHPASGRGRWWTREWASPHELLEDEDENADPVALEVKREARPISVQYGSLRPLYPTRQADISYYTSLHQQLAKLSVTCNEAAAIAKSLASRPDTFRLDNGRIISLGCSSDVIYLEYVPPDVFESGFSFNRTLHCEGLDQIRKVAVRYCHKWNEQPTPRRCPNCGQLHHTADAVKYPNHIYRFLAQYLPNLEQFYFVDYFILRKSSDAETECTEQGNEFGARPQARPQPHTFQGGNRTYYEAGDQGWNVQPKVWEMKSWLQEQFVKYAKTSKLSKHRNPEKVQFGILACEWTVGPPAQTTRGPATPVKKGRNKRRLSEDHSPSRSRRLAIPRTSAVPSQNLPQEATSGFSFVFGALEEESNEFEFTISIPL
ncbi:hypothetical protein ACHAPT_012967 [Fusarium lateritium]